MERKANKFVHKLAERLIKQSYDVALDSDNLRRSFREVVSAMERGRLKKELLLHFSLYFKKLMHKLHADSKLKAKSPASDPELPTHPELTNDRTATSTEFMFNLYSQEQEKMPEIPSTGSEKGKEMLMRLCAPSEPASIKILLTQFEDKMSYTQMKKLLNIIIGQKQPEIIFKYLTMVVAHLGVELEPALASSNKEMCTDLHDFVGNLLSVVHFRNRMTGMSFPRHWSPKLESILSALLSMLVDLSAFLSRSSDELTQEAKKMVSLVLLHLEHSPSHFLDVLLQLSSSSRDAEFLAPLFRRTLCQYNFSNSNLSFLKYVCAIRKAKKILYSSIPTEVDTLIKEVTFKTPSNLVIWLQESADQWMRQIREKSKPDDTRDIVKFILEGAEEEDTEELVNLLTTDEKDTMEDEILDAEEEAGLFFVDKSQDDVQGILPQELSMFEDQSGEEVDSDLEEEMNLADELLAELDRGTGRTSSGIELDVDKEDKLKNDDMQVEKDSGNQLESAEPMDTSEDPAGRSGPGQRSRSPELFVIQEEVSFEERRAQALGLSGQLSESRPEDRDEEEEEDDDEEEEEGEKSDEEEDEDENDDQSDSEEDESAHKLEKMQVTSEVRSNLRSSPRKGRTISDGTVAVDSLAERRLRSKESTQRSPLPQKRRETEKGAKGTGLREDDASSVEILSSDEESVNTTSPGAGRRLADRSEDRRQATTSPRMTPHKKGTVSDQDSSESEVESTDDEEADNQDGKGMSRSGEVLPLRSKIKEKDSPSKFERGNSQKGEDEHSKSPDVSPVEIGTNQMEETKKGSSSFHEGTDGDEGKDSKQFERRQGKAVQEALSSPRMLRRSRKSGGQKEVMGGERGAKQHPESVTEVVSSSEVDENDPTNRGHERLSFPMLETVTRSTVKGYTFSRKDRKREAKSNEGRKSFKFPKGALDTDKGNEPELDEDEIDQEDGREQEEAGKDQSKAVNKEVADYIHQLRKQSEMVTNNLAPRRSTRIRLSSTSSVESSTNRRDNLRSVKRMTLRSRQSSHY
ncbi:uncharacterized protein [Apostichopus japonicus]|uniref:uncharacterized protein isoform X2 n=1 Tax=Stichopus japonicus TaxID=307972 RepID=UPI003AB6CF02